ncbi:hypothetical protein BJ878DRAFT_219088 [Calycina marina]|uniref:Uncharacterized protein n=1 Tax=Calycina marina TaxID=1763456 RepID=A0A9P7YYJ0_9HELO|nr:hypothetical protein BJ878DRAFT_219088 [Calycina marina]
MERKYAELDSEWHAMDMRALQIVDASVDVAIGKGTLNSYIHGSMRDLPAEVRENLDAYVDQVNSSTAVIELALLLLIWSGCTSAGEGWEMALYHASVAAFYEAAVGQRRRRGAGGVGGSGWGGCL